MLFGGGSRETCFVASRGKVALVKKCIEPVGLKWLLASLPIYAAALEESIGLNVSTCCWSFIFPGGEKPLEALKILSGDLHLNPL